MPRPSKQLESQYGLPDHRSIGIPWIAKSAESPFSRHQAAISNTNEVCESDLSIFKCTMKRAIANIWFAVCNALIVHVTEKFPEEYFERNSACIYCGIM